MIGAKKNLSSIDHFLKWVWIRIEALQWTGVPSRVYPCLDPSLPGADLGSTSTLSRIPILKINLTEFKLHSCSNEAEKNKSLI